MNTSRSHRAAQPQPRLSPEVRSHILRDLVAKAAVDDPVHPGWPARAPDSQGGRFRPKPTTPTTPDRLSARDIPAYHPKHPVPLVDSNHNPITDAQGHQLLRPADLPPEMFVAEGLDFDFKQKFAAAQQIGLDAQLQVIAELAARSANFRQGGPWDAQRVGGQSVDEYRDYATIAIGLYMAASDVPIETTLSIENEYAYWFSHFSRDEPKDDVYTSLPRRNVRNTQIGYELYQSGRVRPSP